MDRDKTVHVDSIHFKVCFCIIECGLVMAAKSCHVEKGDNLVNKHFPDLFQTRTNNTGSSDMASAHFQQQNLQHLA